MKASQKHYKRIVIKVGGSLFSCGSSVDDIIAQIADLAKQKIQAVVVSSGAIACGMTILGLKARPKELSLLQAIAALGQNEMMSVYRRGLENRGLRCGQVLLTWDDFNQRKRYLNAKNTVNALLRMGIIPVINENDTVSADEIKFGDNDKLSALVAHMVEADLLIMLSDVDGLLSKDKREIIRIVPKINQEIRLLASSTDKALCVGGMVSKLEAASIASDSGLACVIANGTKKDIIRLILSSALQEGAFQQGTLFLPRPSPLAAKKRWIAFGTKSAGRIYVDRGARAALVEKNKSLLSPGVKEVEGNFKVGDTVTIADEENLEFARGKINYSAEELRKIRGKRGKKEVIHRDNLVII